MESIHDLKIRLAEYCDEILDLKRAELGEGYFYQSLPLCVIDAVYSTGVRYESTEQTVRRYCNFFDLRRIRKDNNSMPSQDKQESIETFLQKMTWIGPGIFAEKIFNNRQQTSSNKGILKSEAGYRFAKTLRNYDVNYFQDVKKVLTVLIMKEVSSQYQGKEAEFHWDTFLCFPVQMI